MCPPAHTAFDRRRSGTISTPLRVAAHQLQPNNYTYYLHWYSHRATLYVALRDLVIQAHKQDQGEHRGKHTSKQQRNHSGMRKQTTHT